ACGGARGASSRAARLRTVHGTPEPLEVVESPVFGCEDVDDDAAEIDQDPAAVRVSLSPCDREAGVLRLLDDGVRDRARLDLRATRGDDEMIGDDRPPR